MLVHNKGAANIAEDFTFSNTTNLYHGGNHENGISPIRTLSTTDDLSYAQFYADKTGGKVYTIEMPNDVFNSMKSSQSVWKYNDSWMGINSGTEWRFNAGLSDELNKYIVPAK